MWGQIESAERGFQTMSDAILRLVYNKNKFATLIKKLENVSVKNHLTIREYYAHMQHQFEIANLCVAKEDALTNRERIHF